MPNIEACAHIAIKTKYVHIFQYFIDKEIPAWERGETRLRLASVSPLLCCIERRCKQWTDYCRDDTIYHECQKFLQLRLELTNHCIFWQLQLHLAHDELRLSENFTVGFGTGKLLNIFGLYFSLDLGWAVSVGKFYSFGMLPGRLDDRRDVVETREAPAQTYGGLVLRPMLKPRGPQRGGAWPRGTRQPAVALVTPQQCFRGGVPG